MSPMARASFVKASDYRPPTCATCGEEGTLCPRSGMCGACERRTFGGVCQA